MVNNNSRKCIFRDTESGRFLNTPVKPLAADVVLTVRPLFAVGTTQNGVPKIARTPWPLRKTIRQLNVCGFSFEFLQKKKKNVNRFPAPLSLNSKNTRHRRKIAVPTGRSIPAASTVAVVQVIRKTTGRPFLRIQQYTYNILQSAAAPRKRFFDCRRAQ